jgi:hypothetical protein
VPLVKKEERRRNLRLGAVAISCSPLKFNLRLRKLDLFMESIQLDQGLE